MFLEKQIQEPILKQVTSSNNITLLKLTKIQLYSCAKISLKTYLDVENAGINFMGIHCINGKVFIHCLWI